MRKQTKNWTTADGTKIRICDMDDSHLLNSIRFLERYAEARLSHEFSAVFNFPEPQGEMAQMDLDQMELEMFDATFWDYLPDIYDNMESECRRRGLEHSPPEA